MWSMIRNLKYPCLKIYLDKKYFSETYLICPRVGCLLVTFCHIAWHFHKHLSSATHFVPGILPWGFVSSSQHALNQAFCLVFFFCKVTDRYFPLQISLVLKYSCKSRICAMVLYNNCFIKNILIFVNCFIFS